MDFSQFEKRTGVVFKDTRFLLRAFTHRSYLNEHPKEKIEHNERFEFLGDAVLELAVTVYLFNRFPERPEGELTAFRAALVNTMMLSDTALELGFSASFAWRSERCGEGATIYSCKHLRSGCRGYFS